MSSAGSRTLIYHRGMDRCFEMYFEKHDFKKNEKLAALKDRLFINVTGVPMYENKYRHQAKLDRAIKVNEE